MINIEKIIPGGQALGTDKDGKKGFFWNALPGETIEKYDITKQKSHYFEAIATKIQSPSKFRVSPKDPCYLSTSPWQIMDFKYENQLKSELVQEVFREHNIEITLPELLTDGTSYFYRNKMEYALYWDNETSKISLAFHARGSHRKAPITSSSIERPEIFATACQIVEDLNARHEEARKYQSLLLRCNQDGQVSGGLFENGKPHPVFKNLTDQILGYTYSYSPNGFFQINLPVYEMALKAIQKHIFTDKVLDLYAGVGTIGLSVARNHHLTLVECDKSAFGELARNCKRLSNYELKNGVNRGLPECSEAKDITIEDISEPGKARISAGRPWRRAGRTRVRNSNIFAILAKSEDALDYIEPDQSVILDPPRAGCDKKLITKLNETKPSTIIYLSCNPATQARDIKLLLEKYQIEDVKTFNFFPRTPHIENLVILQKSC